MSDTRKKEKMFVLKSLQSHTVGKGTKHRAGFHLQATFQDTLTQMPTKAKASPKKRTHGYGT